MSTPPPAKRARREFGLMRPDGASFIGSASGIHFIQTVYNAISKTGLPNHIVPGEDDQLPRGSSEFSLWGCNELSSSQIHDLDLDKLLHWSQSYFDNWHPAFPFLHAPTVVEWLSQLGSSPSTDHANVLGPQQLAIVRSVMSISLADSRQSGQAMHRLPPLVFHSYEEAIQSIQSVLVDRPSVESLQAAMSIQMFLISMLRLNAASRIHGIIIRLVLQMGLHRCPSRYPNFSTAEVEIRRRVFWSAYTLDRYLSQCLGLPITLRDDDTDVCFPDDEKHIIAGHMDDRLAFSCFIAKHARLKGQVLELCNKSINHRQFEAGPFQDLSIAVAKWTNEFEEYTQFTAARSSPLSSIQESVLDALKQEIALSLNRPLLTAPKSSSEYRAASQTCIKAARSLIVDLYRAMFLKQDSSNLSKTSKADKGDFMFWPFLTWSVWISAFFVLFAAVEGEIMQPAAVNLSDQSIDILKYLSTRGTTWPNACQAAIHDLFARFHESAKLNSGHTSSAAKSSDQGIRSKEVRDQIASSGDLFSPISRTLPNNTDSTLSQQFQSLPALESNSIMGGSAPNLDEMDFSLFEGFDIPFWLEIDEMIGVDL